jgi:hypothetical protein
VKRTREDDEDDDDDEDEDDDEPEVKPKHSSVFKRDDNDEDDDDIEELLQNEYDPATWGFAPQSPWSQHEEQNTLVVPLATEPITIPNLYTPEGVGLYYFDFVTYILLHSYLQSKRPTSYPLVTGRGVVVDRDVAVRSVQVVGEGLLLCLLHQH